MATPITDIDRALAALSLKHNLVSPSRAVQLIDASHGDAEHLASAIAAELSPATLLQAIAEELEYVYADLYANSSPYKTDAELMTRVDRDLMRQHNAIPLLDNNGGVVVAVANPADLDLRLYLHERLPDMRLVLAYAPHIQAKLALAGDPTLDVLSDLEPAPPSTVTSSTPPQLRSPLVSWVDSVLERGVAQGASDIHFEFNMNGTMLLRFRIDGMLREQPSPLRGREGEVIGILMNRAGMDSANQRDPQDGSFSFTASARKIDVRVAMLPQKNGPSMVLRLLDSANVQRRLSDMGFTENQLRQLETAAKSSHGTIIVCGPTGSGKTATLYALLREVASVEKNVTTIEDPVEYQLPLVNQTQINTVGERTLSFPRALRAMLRMDPDVILVGEIRDDITAKTALDAAITGHLVLSSLHARDTVGIYTRLSEMGVPSYLVAEAMSLGVSQRLVRRLHDCAHLATPSPQDRALYAQMNIPLPAEIMRPIGCPACDNSGFRGRIACVEILVPSHRFKKMVLEGAGHDELSDQARADGMVPMVEEGLRLVRENKTTIQEVLRTVAGG